MACPYPGLPDIRFLEDAIEFGDAVLDRSSFACRSGCTTQLFSARLEVLAFWVVGGQRVEQRPDLDQLLEHIVWCHAHDWPGPTDWPGFTDWSGSTGLAQWATSGTSGTSSSCDPVDRALRWRCPYRNDGTVGRPCHIPRSRAHVACRPSLCALATECWR